MTRKGEKKLRRMGRKKGREERVKKGKNRARLASAAPTTASYPARPAGWSGTGTLPSGSILLSLLFPPASPSLRCRWQNAEMGRVSLFNQASGGLTLSSS